MNNFDVARSALETSLNSAGSAMQEHERWQQSLESKILALKASWQGLSQAFLNSDFLKVTLDGIINLADGVTKLIDTFGALPTLATAFSAGLSLFKNKGIFTFDKDTESIKLFSTELTGLGDTYKSLQSQIVAYNASSTKSLDGLSGSLSKYLSGLNGAKASVGGYITSLVGAKVATFALQVATVALNTAITMGISALISLGVKKLDEWIVTADELAEKVEEVTSKYKDQHDSLVKLKGDYDTSKEDSLISKYGKLSKGVNSLGENISLTSDEYAEYQSIVDTIANQFPSLVTGYNSQGDAILGCAGSVDKLAESYRSLIKEQNSDVLKNGKDIFKDFDNDIRSTLPTSLRHADINGIGHFGKLNKLLGLNGEDLSSYVENNLNALDARLISEMLDKNGIKRDVMFGDGLTDTSYESYAQHVERAIKEDVNKVKSILDEASIDINAYAEDLGTVTEAYFSTAFLGGDGADIGDFSHMSERMQNVINQITSGFNSEFYAQFLDDENPFESLTKYYDSMLTTIDNLNAKDAEKFEAAFELKTKFNGGDISYGDYVKGIKDVESLIDGLDLDQEVKDGIKLTLNTDEITKNYDVLKERLISDEYNIKMKSDEAEEFLNSLTASEYQVAVGLMLDGEVDFGKFDIKSLRDYIEKEAKLQEAMNYTIAIDVETESIGALNTALVESVSATGLSSESIAALKARYAELESEGYNLSAMFEETSNGIHLNKEAVSELEQALASNKLTETDKQLEVLKGRYDELATEIDNCTNASDRAALYTEQQSIVDKINDLATLASQYKGLTSAYNAWQSAESAGSERDMYEGIIEGFETVGDEINRGWVDDGTIKFLELLTGKTDLASKSGKQLKEIYDSLDDTIKFKNKDGKVIEDTGYGIDDFFTVDKDGNSTNTGVYNFLDAIGKLEEEAFGGLDVVKRDGEGNIIGFDFELVAKKDKNGNVIKNGDQVIAEALGISEELVQIMVRASDDAGFVVNLEGAYTQLADLKTEAESARDTLISLQKNGLEKLKGVDVNFDLNAEGNDLVSEQEKAIKLLDKFKKDGKIDLKMEGAQQALDIAEYLTIKLDDLTEPKYMQLDASKVEEDIREPLEDMQEFEKLAKEKHLLQLTGDTNKIKEVQDDMDEIAQGLEDLDKETKIKLGIDGLTSEEIASKLEKGEIDIPAELKLDVQMSDDLKDIRLLMMDNLGLTSDGEVELKIKYGIDDSTVDQIIKDEKQTVVLEYIAKNEDEFNKYTEEEKETVVKLIADGVDLDNYEVEDKEAIVNYIANGEEVDGWTPEAKDAFVKYLADGGEIDKFDPKNKESWVVYDTDTAKPDGYEADDEEATVTYDKDSSVPDGYDPNDPDATVTYKKDTSDIDGYNPPNFIRTVTYKIKEIISKVASGGKSKAAQRTGADPDGKGGVNGTANVNGTTGRAFKQGSWGTKDSGTALVGELGREVLVRDGKYFTIGNNGAEFIKYRKGDIIFNHVQSEELFKNGKVTSGGGRAKALVGGTAFSSGTGGFGKVVGEAINTIVESAKKSVKKASKKSSSSSSSSGSSGSGGASKADGKSAKSSSKSSKSNSSSTSSSEKEFEESFDWIEVAISRIERAIDNLSQKANNVYKSWSSRNKALTEEIAKVQEEIELQDKAADRYLQEANSVGISSSLAEKVRNGEIDLDTIKDEDLADKIGQYRDWYEKYLDCIDAAEELKETESELYAQKFENVQAQYDAILQGYEHTEAMLNEYISQAEAKGHIISKKYYEALIANEKSSIAELKKEQAELIAERDNAVAEGKITRGSEAWLEQCAAIDEVTQAIEESNTAILEYSNSIRDIDWEIFDLVQERISAVSGEADFLIELMSNKKLFEDDGKLTSQGLATMALHAQNYNNHMYQSDEYGAEIADLDAQIAEDPYNQDLIDRRNELLELQRESILAAEDEKNAIKDLVEESINLELDALQELIDKKNEALESERDLYEYQKKVKEQTEEIASLEKQLAAYSGDDSEEAKQKIQQIKVDLETARQDLEETEYDKFISDTSAMLDTLYTEYELILNQRLDNIDALLESVIESINIAASADGTIATALGSEGALAIAVSNNATSIKDTLESEAKNVGITLSNAMNDIWSVGEGNAKSVLTMYGNNFQDKLTTTNAVLNDIKADIAAMVDDVDKDAQKKATENKTSTSAKKDPTKDSSSEKKTPAKDDKKSTSSGDGKPKVGDKVKFVSGKYYYDSQGKKPLGSKNRGKEVYITKINTKSWATHPYHVSTGKKLGSGDLGWLKLDQLSGYATGKYNFSNDELAWTQEGNKEEYIIRPSDGAILTPVARKGSVLNAQASSNIWNMANSPADFIKENLKLDASNVPNNSNVSQSYTQHIDSVVFRMDNVKNYDEMLSTMQKDKNFEKLINSMTLDKIAGKSSLAKGKSIR